MGCNESKIENEEPVTRCKDRKQHMKDAVTARNAFAAAHSAYTMALKNTGAALSDYAHGEVQYPPSSPSSVPGGPTTLPQPHDDPFPLPPPPLPPYPPVPIQRAASMPEISFPKPDLKRSDPIIEEENEDELEMESNHGGLKHRVSKSSGGGGGIRRSTEVVNDDELEELRKPPLPVETPPPPPPATQGNRAPPPPPPRADNIGMASWDYFFPSMENVPGPNLAEVDDGRVEREEIERKVLEERAKRSEIHDEGSGAGAGAGDGGSASVGGRRSGGKAEAIEKTAELPPQPPQSVAGPATLKAVKRVKQMAPAEGKRKDLLQIFSELDDCFLKASESAHEVSKMLEAARLHYHSNFADNRGNHVLYK